MPAIQRSSNSVIGALASRDTAKLSDAQARFGAVRGHGSYEALLDDPDVDAVYVPLPNSLHSEWTLRAIEAGKHVLCEKPIGLNQQEAEEMAAAARRRGVKLMEAFMYRYTERTRKVIEVIRSGELGEIKQVSSTFRFLLTNPVSIKLRRELGGGALYDVGCYPVNFIGLAMDLALGVRPGGSSPEAISAECIRTQGVDTSFAGVLKYSNGTLGTFSCGFDAHGRIVAEIIGTKGILDIPDTYLNEAGALTLTRGSERREIPIAASDRYRAEIEDFASAIVENRDPLFPLEETLRNAEVIDRLIAAGG